MGVSFSRLAARLRRRELRESAVIEGLTWDETPLSKQQRQRLWQASQYEERPVPLEPYRDALANLLRELSMGGTSCAKANPRIEKLRSEVTHLAHVNSWGARLQHFPGQAQEAYDLFNLAAEMRDATMFDNPRRELFAHGLAIVEEHLGHMHMSASWRSIIRHRLGVEAIGERTCKGCGQREVEFIESGFSGRAHALCEDCGAVVSMSCALEAESEMLRALRSRDDEERQAIVAAVHRPLPRCPCGGRFIATSPTCAKCGGKEFTRRGLSRYEFAHTHQVFQMEELLSKLR